MPPARARVKEEHRYSSGILNALTVAALVVAVVAILLVVTEGGSPALPPSTAQDMVFAPGGTTAYVANGGQVDQVHLRRAGAKGAPTSLVHSISVPGGSVTHLAVSPDGRVLLVATVSGSTGTLALVDLASGNAVSMLYTGGVVDGIAVAPSNRFAVADFGGPHTQGVVGVIRLDRLARGMPHLQNLTAIGVDPSSLAVEPSGKYAFVLDHGQSAASPQQLSTLSLPPLSAAPRSRVGIQGSTAVAGAGLLLSPDGDTAYVGGNLLNVFAVPPRLLPAPAPPAGIASLAGYTAQSMTPDGRFVYLSGGQITAAGGTTQVVEDTSVSPPATATFTLGECDVPLVDPQGGEVWCGVQYSYPVVPVVSSLSIPRAGTAGGYTEVINGAFLAGADEVDFGPGNPAKIESVSSSGDAVSVLVPAGSLGPVSITVSTAGGVSVPGAASTFTYATVPVVSALTPSRGLIQGGTGVLLGGSGFTPSSVVDFGSHPAQVLEVSPDGKYMAVRAPAGSGSVHVSVTTSQGESTPTAANVFHFKKIQPVVTGIAPTSGGPAGGYGILIAGDDFNGATAVYFGLAPASHIVVSSDGQYIGCTVPAGIGTVDVTVTTPSGTSSNVTVDQFTYS